MTVQTTTATRVQGPSCPPPSAPRQGLLPGPGVAMNTWPDSSTLYSRTAWQMNQSECPPLDSLTSFLARSLMRTLSVNGSLDSMPDSASLNLEREKSARSCGVTKEVRCVRPSSCRQQTARHVVMVCGVSRVSASPMADGVRYLWMGVGPSGASGPPAPRAVGAGSSTAPGAVIAQDHSMVVRFVLMTKKPIRCVTCRSVTGG